MKKAKNKLSFIKRNQVLAICFFLSISSLFGIGFCTWYNTGGFYVEAENVNADVGEVIINTFGLKEFGFAIVSGSATNLTSSKRLKIDDETEEKSFIDSNYFSITTTIDTSVMKDAYYSDDAYLTISFSYIGYENTQNNIIDSLILFPENYTNYCFYAKKSDTTIQSKNGTTTAFSFPLKTKNDISLSTIASLDSTYPRTDSHSGIIYKVPIVFKFMIDINTLNTDILNFSSKYSITFGLSTTVI